MNTWAQTIGHWARQNASGLAYWGAEGAVSWEQFECWLDEARGWLRAHGQPARFVVIVPPHPKVLALVAAGLEVGSEPLLVSQLFGEELGRQWWAESEADALVSQVGGRWQVLASRERPGSVDPSRRGYLGLLSSGSTGKPKCVVHHWTSLTAAVRHRDIYRNARWFSGFPLAQFAGLQVVVQALGNGGSLAVPPDFRPETGRELLLQHQSQYVSCTPTYFRRLLMCATPADWAKTAIRQITLGGEIADQALLDAIRAALPSVQITHIYATSELGEVVSVRDGREGFDRALLDGNKLKVEDGQLWVRRTGRSMRALLGQAGPQDEWVSTGDMVEVGPERVRFRGRQGDLINVGGAKVSPIAIESVIRTVAGVKEVCVVGHRSSVAGQLIKALIEPAQECDVQSLRQEILQRCRERLAPFMVPRLVQFTQLQSTAAQKLNRTIQ